jgi:hypothetical protein
LSRSISRTHHVIDQAQDRAILICTCWLSIRVWWITLL